MKAAVSPDGYSVARLNRVLLHEYYKDYIYPLNELSLTEIAVEISKRFSNFGINNYPPASAVVYWFIDGVEKAKIALPSENWKQLCGSMKDEFSRQRSLLVAEHAAMMDPVAMAMSACACSRLRAISNDSRLGTDASHHAMLPTIVELEQAIRELFAKQTPSGIWPKYFPLFHYQEAGSNFCFTFELLEAVLAEFGGNRSHLLDEDLFIDGLALAVTWCEENELFCSQKKDGKSKPFHGWNSGGSLDTLRKGQPESWATAVVHMFLWEIGTVLSQRIQQKLLQSYEALQPTEKWKKIRDLLDIEIWIGNKHERLKRILSRTIVRSFKGKTESLLQRHPQKKSPLSALLFGPPGTSKTEVTKAVAAELGWPLLEIDPSHFLKNSFQDIYLQAEKIFEDVMDLSGVVVLFDEMDALVQKRDAKGGVDTESRFLTTYMLPKLAKLHDRGRVVFFMATNFQANFDDAIKRAGRFDFLLCMGPPTLDEKCNAIHMFYGLEDQTTETSRAGSRLIELVGTDVELKQQLELYTFGEFKSLITGIADKDSILSTLTAWTPEELKDYVIEDSESVGLKYEDLRDTLHNQRCKSIQELDEKPFNRAELLQEELDVDAPVVKYVLDRKQSRRQCARVTGEDDDLKTTQSGSPDSIDNEKGASETSHDSTPSRVTSEAEGPETAHLPQPIVTPPANQSSE